MKTIPILRTTIRHIDVGKRLHGVPTEIVFASLKATLTSLYRAGWYACVLLGDGRGTVRGEREDTTAPPADVVDKLIALAVQANEEMNHGGHWVTTWSQGRISCLWRDGDGDAQFTVDYDEPWVRARAWPVTEFVARAERGYAEWTERMRAVDRRPQDTIKAAQGQKSRGLITLH